MVFETLLRSKTLSPGLRIHTTAKAYRFCIISDDMFESVFLKFPLVAPNSLSYMLNPVSLSDVLCYYLCLCLLCLIRSPICRRSDIKFDSQHGEFRRVVPQPRVCVQLSRDNSLNAYPTASIAEIRNELFAR